MINNYDCECSLCNLYYIRRIKKKYNYSKKTDNSNLSNNIIENKNFTLNDLDLITQLKNLNPEEISKQTNISNSIVNYILSIIS